MTLRRTTVLVLVTAAMAASFVTPTFAERNTGISPSLASALEKTAAAFCDGMAAWADAADKGLIVSTDGTRLMPSPIPRDDKKGAADHDAARQIRGVAQAMGCAI